MALLKAMASLILFEEGKWEGREQGGMYMKVDRKGIDEKDENGKAKCKAIDETKHPFLKKGGGRGILILESI